MQKKLITCALATLCLLLPSGCGQQQPPPAPAPEEKPLEKAALNYFYEGDTRFAERKDVAEWLEKLRSSYGEYEYWKVTEHKPNANNEIVITLNAKGPKSGKQALNEETGKQELVLDFVNAQIFLTGCPCRDIWAVNVQQVITGNEPVKETERLFELPEDQEYYLKTGEDGKQRIYHVKCMQPKDN